MVDFIIREAKPEDALGIATGELEGIYVNPDFVGKGVGLALMDAMLDLLGKDGFKKTLLWVLDSNVKTKGFYEKKG